MLRPVHDPGPRAPPNAQDPLLLAAASSAPTAPVNDAYFDDLRGRERRAGNVASMTRSEA